MQQSNLIMGCLYADAARHGVVAAAQRAAGDATGAADNSRIGGAATDGDAKKKMDAFKVSLKMTGDGARPPKAN